MRRLSQMRMMMWGLGAGVIASLCWLGPVLAVLLGLSGASLLFGAFNDWQYYLMGALFLLVGVVYMLRWQPASVSMNWRRRGRWLFPLVMLGTGGGAYALITFVAVPFLVPLASGSGEGIHHDDQALVVEADISLRQADLRIEGMTWYTWALIFEQVAGLQPGVKHVKAEYPSGDAVVVYDGSRISVEEVITAIQGERPDFEVFVQRDVPLPWQAALRLPP